MNVWGGINGVVAMSKKIMGREEGGRGGGGGLIPDKSDGCQRDRE
jgi:hypothetical protein